MATNSAIPPPLETPLLHAGALILDRVLQRFGFAEAVASEADILDGMVLSLLGRSPS